MNISQYIKNLVVGENAGPRPKFDFAPTGEYRKYSNHLNAGRRSSSPRIKQIIHTSRLTIADIARIYANNRKATLLIKQSESELVVSNHTTNSKNKAVISSVAIRINLLKIISGQENCPAYIRVIEECWKLPIAEIRAIYREDRERQAAGNPITREELDNFSKYYRAHWQGITVEELEAQKMDLLRKMQGVAA